MAEFIMAHDAVDPAKIPYKRLYTGAKIPAIGLGTFGSDNYTPDVIAAAVEGALRVGYRYIDCAACYEDEAEIGVVLEQAMKEGLAREDLFILSKVWNDCHDPEAVVAACKKTLADLRLDYLDCYLVHWPFPNYHAPHCDGDVRNPDSRPYIHEEFMATWRAMESLVDMGLVRHIGTSNVTIPKLELILRDCRIRPAVNELELHPSFQQGELYQYLLDHDIVPIGYSPLGSPKRPERDRTPDDINDLEMSVVQDIARAHGVHPVQICLKWASQRGQIPIPFTVRRENYVSNLRCITEDPLTYAEMDALRSCERNCRLVKGQVFLWPGAQSYLDLWDVDGTIPGWGGYGKE